MWLLLIGVQLWDIRDGACKQTFTGHESDINTISASLFDNIHIITNSFKSHDAGAADRKNSYRALNSQCKWQCIFNEIFWTPQK